MTYLVVAIVAICVVVTVAIFSFGIGFAFGTKKATKEISGELHAIFRGNPKMMAKFKKAGKQRYGI